MSFLFVDIWLEGPTSPIHHHPGHEQNKMLNSNREFTPDIFLSTSYYYYNFFLNFYCLLTLLRSSDCIEFYTKKSCQDFFMTQPKKGEFREPFLWELETGTKSCQMREKEGNENIQRFKVLTFCDFYKVGRGARGCVIIAPCFSACFLDVISTLI